MLRINWTRTPAAPLSEDGEIAREWDRLNSLRLNLPFLSVLALSAALRAFGSGNERLLVGRQGARVVAMFLLVPQGRWRWATFQPSQIPLGAWVAEPFLDLDTLTRGLLHGPLGACLALSITQVDPLAEQRAADTACTRHIDYINTGWIDIEGSFADYWAARGKNLRQNLRKQRNKLAAESVQTRMRMFTAPDDMAPALARYGALESSGWKGAEGTAIHPANVQGRFYAQLLIEAAERSEALVCEYLFDDRSVAMNLCLVREGVLVMLKTTYDESVKGFSPASLLCEEQFREFFAKGCVRRVEMYGRIGEWQSRHSDRQRTLHHLTAYRWPLIKTLAQMRSASKTHTPRSRKAGSDYNVQ